MHGKYPKTLHLPFSPGITKSDRIAKDISTLIKNPIVVSEKVDGGCTTLQADNCYARTHSHMPTHPSFDWVKQLHASIQHNIPPNVQLFGENLFARKEIAYTNLPGYFLLFGIRFLGDEYWADWNYVVERARDLNIPTVPVLWEGQVGSENELKVITERLAAQKSVYGEEREGIVVRLASGFKDEDFSRSICKWVRANHVKSDKHWSSKPIIKNGLK